MSTSLTPTPTPIRAFLALGITSASLFTGINLSLAFISIPSLLNTPQDTPSASIPLPALLTQWQQHYNIAKGYALPLVALTIGTYSYSIYSAPLFGTSTFRGQLLLGGIASMVAAPVFSVLCMEGPLGRVNLELAELNRVVNAREMGAKGEREGTEEKREREVVREKLGRWVVLVTARGLMAAVAAGVGLWAGFDV